MAKHQNPNPALNPTALTGGGLAPRCALKKEAA
jgi:hypothetical protein